MSVFRDFYISSRDMDTFLDTPFFICLMGRTDQWSDFPAYKRVRGSIYYIDFDCGMAGFVISTGINESRVVLGVETTAFHLTRTMLISNVWCIMEQ